MAVYTEVTDDALRVFLEDYDLGRLLSFKGIAEGVENSNFLLHTSTGYFILTLYEKRVHIEDLPFFIGLMDHLASRGFNCPNPVRAKDGEALGELAGRPAAIVTFLDGTWSKDTVSERCRMLGKTMAEFHDLARGFEIRRNNALGIDGLTPLIEVNRDQADSVEPGLAALIDHEYHYLKKNWPRDLPKGVIHADLFPDNVFFLDGELSGIIDFYFACNEVLAYELAIGLNAWCFDENFAFDSGKAAAMLTGYQTGRMLADNEWNALHTLCRGAALRFMLTRLNDWLNVPSGALVVPHDPLQFAGRLKILREMDDIAVLKPDCAP